MFGEGSGAASSSTVPQCGTLSYDTMHTLIHQGWLVSSPDSSSTSAHAQPVFDDSQIQPASLDLTLSDEAYKLPGSILPLQTESIAELLAQFKRGPRIDISRPTILDRGVLYIVRLRERFRLPPGIAAYTNAKSSTGRVDVTTRSMCDRTPRYDKVPAGYEGDVWVQLTANTFNCVVQESLSLNQAIFYGERQVLRQEELRSLYATQPLVYTREHVPVPLDEVWMDDGLLLTIDLDQDIVGFVAKKTFKELDLTMVAAHDPDDFFDPIPRPKNGFLWLQRGSLYIFCTSECIVVPHDYACEMVPYDSTSGEFRAHYAGFFDPGFGVRESGKMGTPGVLEVRAFEDDMIVRHRQPICRMVYERLDQTTSRPYSTATGSNYADQTGPKLSKHFHARPCDR